MTHKHTNNLGFYSSIDCSGDKCSPLGIIISVTVAQAIITPPTIAPVTFFPVKIFLASGALCSFFLWPFILTISGAATGGGGQFFFVCLSAQRSVIAMIIPLPQLWFFFFFFFFFLKNMSESPPPPPKQTPWRRPCLQLCFFSKTSQRPLHYYVIDRRVFSVFR